jgi:hypothetical protein
LKPVGHGKLDQIALTTGDPKRGSIEILVHRTKTPCLFIPTVSRPKTPGKPLFRIENEPSERRSEPLIFWGRPHLNEGPPSISQKGGCHQVETRGIGRIDVATESRCDELPMDSTSRRWIQPMDSADGFSRWIQRSDSAYRCEKSRGSDTALN